MGTPFPYTITLHDDGMSIAFCSTWASTRIPPKYLGVNTDTTFWEFSRNKLPTKMFQSNNMEQNNVSKMKKGLWNKQHFQ